MVGSTNGTDLVPIVEAIGSGGLSATVEVVLSNNETSGILKKARGYGICLLYTSPSPRDRTRSRMPSSA